MTSPFNESEIPLELKENAMKMKQRQVFMEKLQLPFFVQAYRNEKILMSALVPGDPGFRKAAMVLSGALGADKITICMDSYVSLSLDPNTYQRGSLAQRFENGDPEVSEAWNIVSTHIDKGSVAVMVPYTRGYKNIPIPDFSQAKSATEASGNIHDELQMAFQLSLAELPGFDKLSDIAPIKMVVDSVLPRNGASMILLSKDIEIPDEFEYTPKTTWHTIQGIEVMSNKSNDLNNRFVELFS